MLAIFDNDGTICDTQGVEGYCYALAIERVTGKRLASIDWAAFSDPTSTAIVRELLADDRNALEKESQIKAEFCRLLKLEQPRFPGDFLPIPGAIEFVHMLIEKRVCAVAIATGCFDLSARFKLECCGLSLERFPHATASDTPWRKDIIPLAAKRAGFDLSSVVYFGDAPWDVRVSSLLDIPMIGIGRRIAQLREAGVRFVFRDYSKPEAILEALNELRSAMPNKACTRRAEMLARDDVR
jgi:beta-phosphoglucomutase-like phosphatase (HAD superfamily)